MAYEKTWQFLAPQGPYISSNVVQTRAWFLWNFKNFITGGSGATQGLWTILGSSNGVTSSMVDGVDRWTTTYTPSLIPGGDGAQAKGWVLLTRLFGTTRVWLIIANGTNGISVGDAVSCRLSGDLPVGGTTTAVPNASVWLGNIIGTGDSFSNSSDVDYTFNRSIYGALSVDGDFWLAETKQGEITRGVLFYKPIGTKPNDSWPFYYSNQIANIPGYSASIFPFCGYSLYGSSGYAMASGGRSYNSLSAFTYLVQPTTIALTDITDLSLFDFPAWVLVASAEISGNPTWIHTRGRLADTGLCSGKSAIGSAVGGRPVPIGTAIKNGTTIEYVTMNQLILPYNSPVV